MLQQAKPLQQITENSMTEQFPISDLNSIPDIHAIFQAITKFGGTPLLVGGCVRDHLMGIQPKDIDVEVFNVDADSLIEILKNFGRVDIVGVSFGVVKLTTSNADFDFTLPRTENKVRAGHCGFDVIVDHNLTPKEAALRRDFTINSLFMDLSGQITDPFGGIEDIKAGVLCATSHHFAEDPLRVLRAFQFAGRFNMDMDEETISLSRNLLTEAGSLSIERIRGEIVKWALKSIIPSKGLNLLKETEWISLFPEIEGLIGCQQDPEWHPEGDAFIHTGLVCDSAVEIAVREDLTDEQRLILVLAALCHDLGKATTTVIADGRWRSPGHAEAGADLTDSLLNRMGFGETIIKQVIPLVVEHMCHIGLIPNDKIVRRISCRVGPSSISQLIRLMEADHSGRSPLPKKLPESAASILEISNRLCLEEAKPEPIVKGRHLIALGLEPGPNFKEILNRCFDAQIEGEISSIDDGILFASGFIAARF